MMEISGTDLEEKVLTFRVGSGTYGVPLAWVCAVETVAEPGERDCGTYDFRGEKLPFVDLAVFFRSGTPAGGSLLILGKGEAETAALVDNPGVVVGAQEVYKLPDLCQSLVEDTFSGVLVIDERIILMVDPERLCREGGGVGERIGGGGDR